MKRFTAIMMIFILAALYQFFIDLIVLPVKTAHRHMHDIAFVVGEPAPYRAHGDPRSFLLGISVDPGGNVREDNAVDVVLHSDVQGISIAGGEELRIVLVSVVNGSHRMDHIFCRKVVAAGDLGLSGVASVQFPALL